jgi:hypothetical protein
MLNYFKKFAMEIVPSVAATIIGAYIVNHYINAKPAHETRPAAQVSTAQPKSDASKSDPAKANPDAAVAGIPAAGVKAKGVSEKGLLEKNAAAEKAVVVEKPQEKSQDKTAEKPAETTASLPPDTKRPAPVRAAKASPPPVQPVIAAAPADASAAVEDRRDANDLARAAIERLRPEAPRAQPAPRAPEAAHAPEEPRVITASPPALRPLPPPIVVSAPSDGPEPAAPRDPSRPTPPAEIPQAIPTVPPPLDLRAEVAAERPKQKTNVAEDVLSATKSMFHSLLPKSSN